MDACCEVRPVHAQQRRVLRVVLWINLVMFAAEILAGLLAHSTALLADSMDMLGDAIVYGFSLYVIARAPIWLTRAALLKGLVMAAFGIGIAVEVLAKLARGLTPDAGIMVGVALAALVANTAVIGLLWRRRDDDINMRSAWLCSRNDVIANGGVLLAALAVGLTGSAWPDILIGLAIAALFATSAVGVIREALGYSPRTDGRAATQKHAAPITQKPDASRKATR
jgi:cation diffusion facilitator family transporter